LLPLHPEGVCPTQKPWFMKEQNAKFDATTQTGTFSHKAHHGELKLYARISNDAPAAINQNLSGEKGISGAKSILSNLNKKSK